MGLETIDVRDLASEMDRWSWGRGEGKGELASRATMAFSQPVGPSGRPGQH